MFFKDQNKDIFLNIFLQQQPIFKEQRVKEFTQIFKKYLLRTKYQLKSLWIFIKYFFDDMHF